MAHDPLLGSTVDDRYLVLSKVARGGMSTVYLAKDLRLNRNIALKILHQHLSTDTAFLERLQREAWSAASLSHPHVVQIHDHGIGPAHAYLVLEYIDGHTLRDVINSHGPLSPRQALDYLDPIVEGLAAAHAAGLVHRDVKPENVLISRTGWVKIGDFGLARAVTTTTNTGTLLGTVGYIAPELVNGDGGDARTDIYSAGIMLYELLTGVQPFTGHVPIAVAMAHVRDDVPSPSAVLPGLPPEMDELVRYMTEKDPDNRPANGAALLEDLRHIRNTLSPADLDYTYQPPGALPDGPDDDDGEGADGPDWADDNATSVIAADATSVIPTHSHPTSVIPARSRLYVEDPAPAGTGFTDEIPQADFDASGARASKRETRAAAKARARAAARPTKSLGPKHPRRRALAWVVLVLMLAVLGAVAGWFLVLGPGALATVPDVHNKTVAQAQALLHEFGFDSTQTSDVFNESVPQGLVVISDPGPGAQQRRFLGVTLQVSKGPVLYPVPTLTGLQLDAAKKMLADGHLATGGVTGTYNEKAAAGVVLGQDPVAGTQFRGNTKVNLTVSKGPKPIPVPALVGKTAADAEAALKNLGLVAVVAPEQVNSARVPAGSVAAQSPDSGNLTAGGKVSLTISKGPKLVMVPDVVGKQAGAAKAQLEALGFKVKVENLLGGFFGTVRFQSPQGVEAPEGSTVTLQVI